MLIQIINKNTNVIQSFIMLILHTLDFFIERGIHRLEKFVKDHVVRNPEIYITLLGDVSMVERLCNKLQNRPAKSMIFTVPYIKHFKPEYTKMYNDGRIFIQGTPWHVVALYR